MHEFPPVPSRRISQFAAGATPRNAHTLQSLFGADA